jgi:hypothetical protein
MERFVFVRFRNQRVGGAPWSSEPRKWHKILHEHIPMHELDAANLRRHIKYCWPSEFETSLNLLVELENLDQDFYSLQQLLMRIFIGAEEIGEPSDAAIKAPPASVITFPQKAA